MGYGDGPSETPRKSPSALCTSESSHRPSATGTTLGWSRTTHLPSLPPGRRRERRKGQGEVEDNDVIGPSTGRPEWRRTTTLRWTGGRTTGSQLSWSARAGRASGTDPLRLLTSCAGSRGPQRPVRPSRTTPPASRKWRHQVVDLTHDCLSGPTYLRSSRPHDGLRRDLWVVGRGGKSTGRPDLPATTPTSPRRGVPPSPEGREELPTHPETTPNDTRLS